MFLRKWRLHSSVNFKDAPTTPLALPPAVVTAINMPEILECIFTHLSLTVLRRSSSLVCREWCQISQRLILRSKLYTWEGSIHTHTVEKLARELRGVGALQISLQLAYPSLRAATEVLLTAITYQTLALPLATTAETVPMRTSRTVSNNLYHVHDLVLKGLDDSTNFLSRFLPWLQQLTVLRLEDTTVRVFALESLLADCPHLLYLHLHGLSKRRGGSHPLIDFQLPNVAASERDFLTGSEDTYYVKTPLRLRGLRLEGVWIKETVLFALLNCCPDIYQLNLQLPSIHEPTHQDLGGGLTTLDRREFFEHMASYYPQLTSLQFSRAATKVCLQNVSCAMVEAFPHATEWVMILRDMSPSVFESLMSVYSPSGSLSRHLSQFSQPMLTSLTIVYTNIFDEHEDNSLHRLLCQIPTLLHLHAESVPYLIENLDLNNILPPCPLQPSPSPSSTQQVPKQIWACRGLKTLHLRFYTRHKDEKRGGSLVITTASRILCGYLSRFCPRLEDMSIHYFQLDMTLQGGFCLLTRLKRLRRLHLSSVGEAFSERDVVPWICKRLSRMQRMERAYKVTISLDKKGVDRGPMTVLEEGLEEISIRHLGLLADVGDALAEILEMSKDDKIAATNDSSPSVWSIRHHEHVWPDLADVSIVFSKPLFKEDKKFVATLLKKHRPEVCLRWVWWLNQNNRKYRPYVSN
ncbi:hypothetical protein BGZ82_005401 [Podila clonocystis]|nr:hypothetical protein BGZ82_005401 [Podila clonocystis]